VWGILWDVSRGPGRIQEEVLEYLIEYPGSSVWALQVAHWESDVRYEGDTEPTKPRVESARRALKRLERAGLLTSTLDPEPDGHNPRRLYRLADQPSRKESQ
jgi:hypothetical protein